MNRALSHEVHLAEVLLAHAPMPYLVGSQLIEPSVRAARANARDRARQSLREIKLLQEYQERAEFVSLTPPLINEADLPTDLYMPTPVVVTKPLVRKYPSVRTSEYFFDCKLRTFVPDPKADLEVPIGPPKGKDPVEDFEDVHGPAFVCRDK